MPKKIDVMVAVGLFVGSVGSFAQEPRLLPCLHPQSETPAQRVRRQQALKVAHEINLAEAAFRPKPNFREQPTYRPLKELPNIPSVPAGFRMQFYTDGPTYTFSMKDTFDACEYAIFSDQDQGIYESTPTKTVGVVPLGTH